MIPVLFDTNIYGKIVSDVDDPDVIERIISSRLTVLNFSLIRSELRQTSKRKVFKTGRKVRISLLDAYDRITSDHQIAITKDVAKLAELFFQEYKRLGGNVAKRRILNDFKIVACATIKGYDVIASEDRRTMQNPKALSAYAIVAMRFRYGRAPGFMSYSGLKRAVSAK